MCGAACIPSRLSGVSHEDSGTLICTASLMGPTGNSERSAKRGRRHRVVQASWISAEFMEPRR